MSMLAHAFASLALVVLASAPHSAEFTVALENNSNGNWKVLLSGPAIGNANQNASFHFTRPENRLKPQWPLEGPWTLGEQPDGTDGSAPDTWRINRVELHYTIPDGGSCKLALADANQNIRVFSLKGLIDGGKKEAVVQGSSYIVSASAPMKALPNGQEDPVILSKNHTPSGKRVIQIQEAKYPVQ